MAHKAAVLTPLRVVDGGFRFPLRKLVSTAITFLSHMHKLYGIFFADLTNPLISGIM